MGIAFVARGMGRATGLVSQSDLKGFGNDSVWSPDLAKGLQSARASRT